MAILKDTLALVLHRPARAVRTGIGRAILWFTDPVEERRRPKRLVISEDTKKALHERLLGVSSDIGQARENLPDQAERG